MSPPPRSSAWHALRHVRGGPWPVLGILALGLALRLSSWNVTFQPAGVMPLADSDPYYHVLRAERLMHGAPGAPWRDPAMNWPLGTDLLWPPLFDAVIAGGARLIYGVEATRQEVARVAVFVPVIAGLLTIPLVAVLGRLLLGGRRGRIAAFLIAVLPAHAAFTVLGRADQHAAELLLFTAILLIFARALRAAGSGAANGVVLSILVATAFWTWQGSTVLLVVPFAFTLLWHVIAPEDDPARGRAARATVAAGFGGAALLAVTIAAFGPAGALAHPAIAGVNGLAVAITAGMGAAGAVLVAASRSGSPRGRWRRAIEAVGAVVLPTVLLFGFFPGLREGASGGLAALLRGNPWYQNISEFRPIFFDPAIPLVDDVVSLLATTGLVLVAVAAAVPAAVRRWRCPTERATLGLLGAAVLVFLVAAVARRRFTGYMIIPAAVAAEMGARAIAARVAGRLRAVRWVGRRWALTAVALLVAAPAIPADLQGVGPLPHYMATAMETFLEAKALVPPPGREAVLAPWSLGHLVQYCWERPVIVSPFGVDGGRGAFEAWAAFFFAKDPAEAEAALAARRVAWVVLDEPADPAQMLGGFAPTATPRYFDLPGGLWDGVIADATPAYWGLIPARLYHGDGRRGGPRGAAPLTGFRLVLESPPAFDARPGAEAQYKIFGVVAGARVTVAGARPGSTVEATARIRTNLGRAFSISYTAPVEADGRARLRLPYATGVNGLVRAAPWLLTDGGVLASLSTSEEDVVEGRALEVALPPAGKARP